MATTTPVPITGQQPPKKPGAKKKVASKKKATSSVRPRSRALDLHSSYDAVETAIKRSKRITGHWDSFVKERRIKPWASERVNTEHETADRQES